jgi:hypothetical protein
MRKTVLWAIAVLTLANGTIIALVGGRAWGR